MARQSAFSSPYRLAVVLLFCRSVALGAGETSFSARSDPGDFVGDGGTFYLTPDAAEFLPSVFPDNAVNFIVRKPVMTGALDDWWTLTFAAPDRARLLPGIYLEAFRWPYQPAGQPGLDVSNTRGCNESSGSFTVHQASYAPTGELVSFWATFEQHCELRLPALRGEIRFNAAVAPQNVPALTGPGLLLLSIGLAAAAMARLHGSP